MPEGPEIKRAADTLAKALVDRPVKELFFAFDHLKPYEQILQGEKVTAIKPRGKAMVIRFERPLNIYSHNQLYGKWVVRPAYSYPDTQRQLRLALHNAQKSALLYSASDIDVLSDDELLTHPFLSRLGPDVLDETVTVEQVAVRFLDPRFRRRQLASLLLDQQFLCGLGNYLRSEVLFVAGVHPTARPMDCSPDQIQKLAEAAIALTRQSYETGGITNDLQRAKALKQQGWTRQAYRHHAFYRDQKPCFSCGTEIVKDNFGGRRVYLCPTCQPKS